jgi:hypothetical protein
MPRSEDQYMPAMIKHEPLECTNRASRRRLMWTITHVCTFLILLASSNNTVAEPQSQTDSGSTAEMLLAGLREQRELLRQGIVRSTGKMIESGGGLEGPSSVFCAFDMDQDLFRFDRDQPIRTKRTGAPDDSARIKQIRFAFSRIQNRSMYYQDSSGSLTIQNWSGKLPITLCPFDIRAVGLLFSQTYRDGTPFEKILDGFCKLEPHEVVAEGNGVYRIHWLLGSGQQRRTLWVDAANGYSPIRLEVQDRRFPFTPNDDDWPAPFAVSRAEWTKMAGVWVPITFFFENRGPGNLARYEHTFLWESVNRTLPKELFTAEGLKAPKGTLVLNKLGRQTFVEKVIGVENSPFANKELLSSTPENISRSIGWRLYFVIANVVVVLLLSCFWLRRRLLGRYSA